MTVRFVQGVEVVFSLKAGQAVGKSYWGSGHAACIGDFYRSLEQGTPYANDLQSVENTMQVMARIYESTKGEKIF